MRCLFVGGAVDGQMIDVAGAPPEYFIRVPEALPDDPGPHRGYRQERKQSYKRQTFVEGESRARYAVYLHGNVAQPIRMLLEGYAALRAELEKERS